MTDEEINNVSKVFEALTRAKGRKENIKIEYLNDEGGNDLLHNRFKFKP